MRIRNNITIILVVTAVATGVFGQAALPPESRVPTRTSPVIKISRESRQFAEDYFEILTDVRDLYADYSEYFGDLDNASVVKISDAIAKTILSLDKGAFNSNPKSLKSEMDALARNCAQFEKVAGHSAPDRKALKLSRTLENDLEQLIFDLEASIEAQQRFSSAEQAAIGRFISDSLSSSHNIEYGTLAIKVEELARLSTKLAGKATERVLDSLAREIERAYAQMENNKKAGSKKYAKVPVAVIELPDIPEVPGVPAPEERLAPAVIGRQSMVWRNGDEVSIVSELEDTLTLSRRQMPVKINSRFGNVSVIGVAGRTITSRGEITINARSERDARTASRKVHFSSKDSSGVAIVTLNVPDFDDPRTRVASSDFSVEVPEGCALTVDSRFGTTTISEIRGDVTINGDHTQISVSRCEGALTIDNSMGMIQVEEFRGPIDIETSHDQVHLKDIQGDITAKNSFAETIVSQSHGAIDIVCKGSVQIEEHHGDITVENSTGSTSVRDLHGDAHLTSSFGSVELTDIEGDVTLASSNGSVACSRIDGVFEIESKMGNFEAQELSGALKFTNIDGVAEIELNVPLSEPSTIESTRGRVEIRMSEDADVRVSVQAKRGSVRGPSRLRIVERGQTYSAEAEWGSGSTTLRIGSEDALIEITDN